MFGPSNYFPLNGDWIRDLRPIPHSKKTSTLKGKQFAPKRRRGSVYKGGVQMAIGVQTSKQESKKIVFKGDYSKRKEFSPFGSKLSPFGADLFSDLKCCTGKQTGIRKSYITVTCLYNFDPFKPNLYIVKLGFTGVCISFLISAQKHRLLYSL